MKRFPWLPAALVVGAVWLAVQHHRIGAWQEANAVLRTRLADPGKNTARPVGEAPPDMDAEIAALRLRMKSLSNDRHRPVDASPEDPATRAELERVQKQVAVRQADRARRKAWEERRSGYHQLAALVSGLWQQGGSASWPRTDPELAVRLREFAALVSESPGSWDTFPGGVRFDQFEVLSPPQALDHAEGMLLMRERRPVEDPDGKPCLHHILSNGQVVSTCDGE